VIAIEIMSGCFVHLGGCEKFSSCMISELISSGCGPLHHVFSILSCDAAISKP
jgi:hypothetical protein